MNLSLETLCVEIRRDILTMIHKAGSGHPGGSLSSVEILTVLYFGGFFDCNPENPGKLERDRFILSKGHCAPVLYSILCRRGFFDKSHLDTLRKLGSILQGHPHTEKLPGLDSSSGSLGQGLSIANGIALAYKMQGIKKRVYCLLGDGELQEGQIWEAALSAAQHRLDNVCAIIDNNHVQLDGTTEEIKKMEPIADKWRSFGWNVIEADGHTLSSLMQAYNTAQNYTGKPSVIIAKTVKGKGVSFMENKSGWHGLAPNAQQLEATLAEIDDPCFIRFGREAVPLITDIETPFELGKVRLVSDGSDAVLFANGSLVYEGMLAATELLKSGISLMVVDLHTVKPLDMEFVFAAAKKTGCVITAEEHQIAGGMGGAVCEFLSEVYPVPIYRIGVTNSFGESGKPEELMKKYGLCSENIIKTVKKALKAR